MEFIGVLIAGLNLACLLAIAMEISKVAKALEKRNKD